LTKSYRAVALVTSFWRPGEDYVKEIIDAILGRLKNGDILTVSEKALSTASGNIVDEDKVKTTSLARFLAHYWMRLVWGYALGKLCHLRVKTIDHFRTYPLQEGSRHKQVALRESGFLQALMHGSEGGIDGSNLPYSYVSLALRDAPAIADKIRERVEKDLGKNVTVMIIDTDKMYSFRNFHFSPRPSSVRGIKYHGGFIAYLVGRFLKLKQRATPIAISGGEVHVEYAIRIADIANRARGFGAGRNVWEMAQGFGVSLTGVTWDMLEAVKHKPIVIVRSI
jgi:F420-0:gamma-glutamyl ligase-like protein